MHSRHSKHMRTTFPTPSPSTSQPHLLTTPPLHSPTTSQPHHLTPPPPHSPTTSQPHLFPVDGLDKLLELALGEQLVGGVAEEDAQLPHDGLPLPLGPLPLHLRELTADGGRGHGKPFKNTLWGGEGTYSLTHSVK